MQLRPGPIGNFTISATWFDNETQLVHEVDSLVQVTSQVNLLELSFLKVALEYHQMESWNYSLFSRMNMAMSSMKYW